MVNSVAKERVRQLHEAAIQLVRGFERATKLDDKTELAEALREASAALIEMRRETDDLSQHLRFHR